MVLWPPLPHPGSHNKSLKKSDAGLLQSSTSAASPWASCKMKRWGWGQRLLDEKMNHQFKSFGALQASECCKNERQSPNMWSQNPLTENLIRQSWQLKTNQDYIHIGTCMDVAQTKNVYHLNLICCGAKTFTTLFSHFCSSHNHPILHQK